MFDLIANVLAWFYSLVGDYAISIVLLTLLIMLIFTPLTLKGTRSMMQMQRIQPKIKQLQNKHRGDKQALNQAMMELYQREGVNPLGGCLPSLVQLPVFFVLYRVINGLTRTRDDVPEPSYLDQDSDMYVDLVADGGEMVSFGIDLSRSANDVLQDNFVDALPYLGLVAFTGVLSWYQQRQMKARRTDSSAVNPQMEMMMKILPFMLPVFSFIVQAALAVYFVASSLYRIAQQAFIHATMKPLSGEIIEAQANEIDDDPEPERPTREVANKRSKKALAADDERQAAEQAREERSRQRREGDARKRAPRPAPSAGKGSSAKATGSKFSNGEAGAKASNRRAAKGKAKARRVAAQGRRKRGAPEELPGKAPIQSKRTSGDGRTRKRRK